MDSTNTYKFKQNNIGFYLPLHSSSWIADDQITTSSLHILAGADIVRYKPNFEFINEQFKISRFCANIKLFYVSGNKSILYASLSPFTNRVIKVNGLAFSSISSSLIYNRTVTTNFSYRIGIINTYSFGRSLMLPILGLRIGALNKTHFSIQFPRNIALDIPIGRKTIISIFGKSQGGVYAFKFSDSIITKPNTRFILGRYEVLHGIQANFKFNNHFSMYLGLGFTNKRHINFTYIENSKKMTLKNKIPPSGLFTFGLSIRLGKTVGRYNDPQMSNLFELNSSTGSATNDRGTQDNEVAPHTDKFDINKIDNIKYKDVEDLITDEY